MATLLSVSGAAASRAIVGAATRAAAPRAPTLRESALTLELFRLGATLAEPRPRRREASGGDREESEEDLSWFHAALRRSAGENVVPHLRRALEGAVEALAGGGGDAYDYRAIAEDAKATPFADDTEEGRRVAFAAYKPKEEGAAGRRARAVALAGAAEALCRWRFACEAADSNVRRGADEDAHRDAPLPLPWGQVVDAAREALGGLARGLARLDAAAEPARARDALEAAARVARGVDAATAAEPDPRRRRAARASAADDADAALDAVAACVPSGLAPDPEVLVAAWAATSALVALLPEKEETLEAAAAKTAAAASKTAERRAWAPTLLAGALVGARRRAVADRADRVIAAFRLVAALTTRVVGRASDARAVAEAVGGADAAGSGTEPMPARGSAPPSPSDARLALGRSIAGEAFRAAKASRFRKNAHVWAAAASAALHPAFFPDPRFHAARRGDEPTLPGGTSRGDEDDETGARADEGARVPVPEVPEPANPTDGRVGSDASAFVRDALALALASGGARVARVLAAALAARLARWPELAPRYADVVFALALSGEGEGVTENERRAAEETVAETEAATKRRGGREGSRSDTEAGAEARREAEEAEEAEKAEHYKAKASSDASRTASDAASDASAFARFGLASPPAVPARVSALCLAHRLAVAEPPRDAVDPAAREAYASRCAAFSATLAAVALEALAGGDGDLAAGTYRRGSATHRRKIRAWRVLCAVSPALPRLLAPEPPASPTSLSASPPEPEPEPSRFFSALVAFAPSAMATHNLPGVRYHAEVFFALAALANRAVSRTIALPELRKYASTKPAVAASWIVVATSAAIRGGDVEAARDALEACAPWASSHNHAARVFAQVAMHDLAATFGEETLLRGGGGGGGASSFGDETSARDASNAAGDASNAAGDASTRRSSSSLELRALRATLAMLRENKDAAKTREACGPVMTGSADATPRGMLAGSLDVEPARSDSADRFGFEGVPTSALDRVEAFLRRSREELRRERELVDAALWEDALREKGRAGDGVGRVSGAGETLVGPDGRLLVRAPAGASTRDARENRSPAGVRTVPPGFAALQKKVEPPSSRAAAAEREGALASERYASEEESDSESNSENSDSDSEHSDSDPTRTTRGARRKKTGGRGAPPRRPPGLIVVASLVDKLPNLAGLARTCEVLGAEALVVADAKVFAKPEFASISVTAERWLPTREVPRTRLGAYLEALRREGYWLVGLEQTRGATSLDAFRFREKTALVLGREREGVDADVLARLDECVVVPQEGLIRSLNVHVSASLAVAEYAAARRRGGLVREGEGGW